MTAVFRRMRTLAVAAAVLAVLARPAAAADDDVLVVTALPVTFSIATALAEGTSIEVRNVPEGGRRLNSLGDVLERRADRFAETLGAATAVVTIGKLWSDDPLYTAARAANIRVVEIDATKPWSTSLEGVSVATAPHDDVPFAVAEPPAEREPSIYFWLSPTNGARAAGIVGRDLMRLAPDEAGRIQQNLDRYRAELIALKQDYELRLAELPDVTVAALAAEFVYLTNDLGIFVDGYFLKQDIDWTEADLGELEAWLRDNDIGVVIHKWEPRAPILETIESAGAELVVLDPIDLGIVEDDRLAPDGYVRLLRENLAALHSALAAANR